MSTRSASLQVPSSDDPHEQFVQATKRALQTTTTLTDNQYICLTQAIRVLTYNYFQEQSSHPCQTPSDVAKMLSGLLNTFSFKHIISQKPSDNQSVHLFLQVEKVSMSFNRVIELFWQMVSSKNPHWNRYEFSSSFQDSSQSQTDDFFRLKLSHNPNKKPILWDMPGTTRSIPYLTQQLQIDEEYVTVAPPTIA